MSDNFASCVVFVGMVCFFIGMFLGALIKGDSMEARYQREACLHGCAEWSVDKNGDPIWQWKELKK